MSLDLALDFAHGLDPAAFAEDRLGFRPDPWQSQVLRSRARWILLNCCRQSGKSTTTALVALHTAIYDPGLILLVSPSLRQSKELFAKTAGFLKRLEPVEELEEDNKSSCTLANGGRKLLSLSYLHAAAGSNYYFVYVDTDTNNTDFHSYFPSLFVGLGSISVKSVSGSKRFCIVTGSTVTITSSVGDTYAART